MKYNYYTLRTLTNLHVGSGQNAYGIVDNVVQRDVLNNTPIIHSTSLKGALKEWMSVGLNKKTEAQSIFGKEAETGQDNVAGTHILFTAQLLSFPMRSEKDFYQLALAPFLINEVATLVKATEINKYNSLFEKLLSIQPSSNEPVKLNQGAAMYVEQHTIRTKPYDGNFSDDEKLLAEELFGPWDKLILMDDNTFKNCMRKLPIIARNQLDNGQSKNLFYEEVVPRETRFGFVVGQMPKATASFEQVVDEAKIPCQIGANATVGYGYCALKKVN